MSSINEINSNPSTNRIIGGDVPKPPLPPSTITATFKSPLNSSLKKINYFGMYHILFYLLSYIYLYVYII